MFGSDARPVNSKPAVESTAGQGATSRASRLRALARVWDRLLAATVFPATCSLCGAAGLPGTLDLCATCAETLPRLELACERCAEPLTRRPQVPALAASGICTACTRMPPPFDLAVVPYLYAYPVDRMVRLLKYEGERVFARVLGSQLAGARVPLGPPWPERIVPMPLHALRFRERGYNQARELARYASRALGVPVADGHLERVLATREQTGLGAAERRRNVRHAFTLRRALGARRVALLDDVLTTGSTAAEAARVLKDGGVEVVELWAVARARLAPRRR